MKISQDEDRDKMQPTEMKSLTSYVSNIYICYTFNSPGHVITLITSRN